MRRPSTVTTILLSWLATTLGANVFAQEFVPGEALLVFNDVTPEAARQQVIRNSGVRVIEYFEHVDVYHVTVAPRMTVAQTVALLERDGRVRGASPNYYRYSGGHLKKPNDPEYLHQWALDNFGTNLILAPNPPPGGFTHTDGVIDADIDAPQGWEHLTDCSGEVVAILDSGVDITHPDFADLTDPVFPSNIWSNTNEIAGDNIDNDGNGVIDDVHGANFSAYEMHAENVIGDGLFNMGEAIYWDIDSTRTVTGPDTLLSGPAQPVGTPLIHFLLTLTFSERHAENVMVNGVYDAGESIYLDVDHSGTVSVGDKLIQGGIQPLGSALVAFTFTFEMHAENVNANNLFDIGEAIYQDVDGTMTVTAPDNHVSGPAQPMGTMLVNFLPSPFERHTENVMVNGVYDAGESIYFDTDNSGTVTVGDVYIQGPLQVPGTMLVPFVRRPNNNLTDTVGHGTNVASVVGARGNNGMNIAGVCWRVQILTVKVARPPPPGGLLPVARISDEIAGINYVIGLKMAGINVRIINASIGAPGMSLPELNAIIMAGMNGILFVTAAGNNGQNVDTAPGGIFPCNYVPVPVDCVICVGASNNRDNLASFSNWGTASVDLNAPGRDILMLNRTQDWGPMNKRTEYSSGTSFAAPHVAGIAAHFWSLTGFETHTVQQLKNRLLFGFDGPVDVPHPHGVDPRWGGQFPPAMGPVGTVVSGINNDGRARITAGDDFGDAPDTPGQPYPTILAFQLDGARHEDIGEEWLGRDPDLPSELFPPPPPPGATSDVSPEFEAYDDPFQWPPDPDPFQNLIDTDSYDDGIILHPPYVWGGFGLVDVLIDTESNSITLDHDGGRYGGAHGPSCGVHRNLSGVTPDDDKYLWVNGFFDWNGDGDWDDPDEHVFTIRADPSTWLPASGAYYQVGFNVPPPPPNIVSNRHWARFRLDYGENLGRSLGPLTYPIGPSPGGLIDYWNDPGLPHAPGAGQPNRYESIPRGLDEILDLTRGVAQFGEVEDYQFTTLNLPGFYHNGEQLDDTGAPASQKDPVFPFFAEAADDFVLPGIGSNDCEISQVRFWVSQGVDPVDSWTGLKITIYEDVGVLIGEGNPPVTPADPHCPLSKGPSGYPVPLALPDRVHNACDTAGIGVVCEMKISVNQITSQLINLPCTGLTWEVLATELNGFACRLQKNRKYWIAIAPEMDIAAFGQSFWMLSDVPGGTGHQAQQIFEGFGIDAWTPIAGNAGDPVPAGCAGVPPPGTHQDLAFQITATKPCPEDVNGDGTVNVLDLIDLLLCFGQPAVPPCDTGQDVKRDGTVNVLDLIQLLLAFGTACP